MLVTFNIFYSKFINNSSNIRFSSNLTGCHDCILCNDLQNSSYCINNKQYEKEEYLQKRNEILMHKSDFLNFYKGVQGQSKNIMSQKVT